MLAPLIVVLWLAGTITFAGSTDDGRCVPQPSSTCDTAAITEFTTRVQEYLRVRQGAARGLPLGQPFDDPAEPLAVRKALRQAIRDARPDARVGDLFTPGAAAAFRHIVTATAAAHRVDPKDLVRELRAEREPGAKHPSVNHRYDWRLGAWMWPALLHALPSLPEDLQYRIVDNDLVLVDLQAGLVVDILEDAMAADED